MATVKYTVRDNWGSGFIGNMTVEGGTSGTQGWTVEFDAGFAITNIWGAEIVSHVGTHYVLRNASYNANVPSGGSITFGFQATPGSTGGTAATGLSLNGEGNEPPVLPTLTVGDASVVEGNSGTKQMTFTVSLSEAATGPVTVNFATANGTATAGEDYVSRSGTITFAAGETQKTISVTVNGDKIAELNDTLALNLSAPTGATIADGVGTGTILTDDVIVPQIAIADATVKEGDSGTRTLSFIVTLSQATTNTVTVTYGTADGTAKAGQDYTGQTGTLSFAPGETSKVINVEVIGETAIENNETLKINLTSPTGATIADRSAIGTIVNDDARISVSDASVTEGNNGTSNLAFTVTLSAAASGPVTVAYATSNGTARAGQDYTAQTGTLIFAAGETSKVVNIQVTGDTAIEADETLRLTLSSPTGATIRDGAGVGSIVNDDSAVLPALSITDASASEGSMAAPGHTTFTVNLSSAATGPVTVHFETADGTAVAGSDYVAQSGTLTFAAGETQKTIQIATIGDAVVEANEGFSVVLSSATGAAVADATGIGTILNDDAPTPTLPTLSISDASVIEGDPGTGAAPGWLSTSGNQIVDSAGHTVQIAGVNWFGFENNDLAPHGLWTRNYKEMMDQMADLGFNTIRLPFSNDTLHSTGTPNINYWANPDLQGLTALQVMDKIVAYAEQIGLKIILDHHRNNSGASASENGLWYDSQHSEADWISDWKMLAERYADNPAVIGADLHNEPYNGTWGGGGPNDWAAAAERAGNAIGEVNPNMLIFVEGVANYQGQSYWWGGNLMGVRDRPIELDIANKLVYSAHDYPNSVYAQPWFQGADFPANLPAKFDQMWGYIYKEGIAPVYIGEFGTKLQDPKDAPWLEAITSYLSGDLDNNGTHDLPAGQKGVSWTFWSWNPNSSDTGGILANDWRTVNQDKMGYLSPIQYEFHEDAPGDGGTPVGPTASFVLTLSEAATQEVTVDYQTVYGEAGATDFIASTGHVTFAIGEQSKTITIEITPDTLAEGNEHFGVVLTNAVGATISRGTGTATIVDDDAVVTPPPTPPESPEDVDAVFAIVNSWSGGFNGSVTLENDGAGAINGWQVKIETTNQITDIWNAVIVSHDASGYVVGNASYNGTIAHDGETSFGFVATGAQDPSTVHIDLLQV